MPIPPLVVGHREIAVGEHEDERAHVRMDFAEDADDAGLVEAHRTWIARRRTAQVERLAPSRARRRCGRSGRCSGNPPCAGDDRPARAARRSRCAGPCRACGSSRVSKAAARRGVEVHDAAAPVRDVARAAQCPAHRRRAAIGGHVHRRHLDAAADGARHAAARRRSACRSSARPVPARRAQQQGDPTVAASGVLIIRTSTRLCAGDERRLLHAAAVAPVALHDRAHVRLRCT